jgi:2-haloacid dehalogenase
VAHGAGGGSTAIDAVVFDLGNVLIRWDPFGPFLGRMERGAVEAFFAEIDFHQFNHLQDAGRTWAQARDALRGEFPEHVPALDIYIDHYAESLRGPVDDSEALVRDLRDAGVRVFGLTNWSAESFHLARLASPAIDLLEGVLVSGEVGVAKPDPAIFELMISRYGLAPERTVFTDDSPVNTDAATAAGFVALVFRGASGLRRELVALGVPIEPSGSG